MTAETECCEACRPVELAHPPYRYKHGWVKLTPEEAAAAEKHLPAGVAPADATPEQVTEAVRRSKRAATRARARERAENRAAYTRMQRGLGPPGTAPRRSRVPWASQSYPGPGSTWANAPPLEPPKA